MIAAGARRHLPGQHHLQRVADAGLVDRGGEVFFHLLTLLGGQHLAHVEVVFHTIIPHLLVQLAKGGQLLFDLSVIPFSEVNNVCQSTILIAADFNLAYIIFESLTQRLALATCSSLSFRCWTTGSCETDGISAEVDAWLAAVKQVVSAMASRVLRKRVFTVNDPSEKKMRGDYHCANKDYL